MNGKKWTLEDKLCLIGLAFCTLGFAAALIYRDWFLPRFGEPGCVFQRLFGIYCPGCGGTRAVFALLRGDILLSLYYHPLVPYAVFGFDLFLLDHVLERLRVPGVKGFRFHAWPLYLAIVILIVNCVARNILKLCFGVFL